MLSNCMPYFFDVSGAHITNFSSVFYSVRRSSKAVMTNFTEKKKRSKNLEKKSCMKKIL